MTNWLTLEEAAQYLKMGKSTLYDLARKGKVPAHKMGRAWRFDADELDRHVRIEKASRGNCVFETKPSSRRITDPTMNGYLSYNGKQHQFTRIAPLRLLQPLSKEIESRVWAKQKEITQKLHNTIGPPVYSAPGFILYCGDCVELLEKLIEARFMNINLTITSPPYNIGKEYETPRPVNDYVEWCSRWMTYVYEVTSPTGSFWLNLGYLEVPGKGLCVPIPYLIWDKSPFYLLQEVVWHYTAGVSTKKRLSPRNEKWLYFVKNHNNYTFDLDDIRDPNVKYPNQKKKGKYRCNPLGKNPSDVWIIPKVTTGKNRSSKERTAHPAQFPLVIVERITLASSRVEDVVLDPFAGSCSSGIAAAALGRIFVGIEINAKYCSIGIERYEKFNRERRRHAMQQSLFHFPDRE